MIIFLCTHIEKENFIFELTLINAKKQILHLIIPTQKFV